MGTRYRYYTPDGGAPNNGIPPGLEPPQGTMFSPQFPFGGPSPFGPPQFGPSPFGSPPFGQPPGFPSFCGALPPPGPMRQMMCFPTQAPPPYTPNPWSTPPMLTSGPSVPSLANERPPPGARVNGQIAKFNNKQGHIHSKNNTTFHLILDGVKPWNWGAGGNHRFTVCTASSSMPIDEFVDQVGAIEKAPYGTPREQIGIQEAIEEGDGQFRAGAAFRLGDSRITYQRDDGTVAYQTLEQLGWSANRGEVGRGKPVTIAFLP